MEFLVGIYNNIIQIIQNYYLRFYNYTGSLPNSRRKIEPEIMRFMMQSSQIERRFNTLALNHQAIFQILFQCLA